MPGEERGKRMGVDGAGDKKSLTSDVSDVTGLLRKRLRDICECENILEDVETRVHGRIAEDVDNADDNVSSSDEVDEILESEYHRLNNLLDLLPADTHSLTLISPKLPTCVKYGVRSGLAHHRMQKFSPLSRGLQGAAIAIAAFATTALVKARCWNELIIDQIVDDGDTYYCESYDDERRHTDDRRNLTILDLNGDFVVQKTHRVYVKVEEPVYAGTFRSTCPTDLHIAKALELFFERYDAGVLVSSILNMAIWRDARYFNIFDGQARRNDLSIVTPTADDHGSAKLILVRDLTGVLFVILEKSHARNEHFVIYGLTVRGIERLATDEEDDPEEPEKSVGKPLRRPSGYKIPNKYRAIVRGSFHLAHKFVPEELRSRGHLIVALAALIYSRLIRANKWTSAIIDLILNQSHIYLIDLARFLDKTLDDTFELKIEDAMGDVLLGPYAAKVNVRVNVVPGQGKKGKATLDSGFRDFFATNNSGILEIKKVFYAVWKDGEKYYYFDPFGCDDEGFRVDPTDPENTQRYEDSRACVTMNSSVNELIETILENTGNKEKDPFIIHGLGVLYVKTGSNGGPEMVIYREKNVNRRPLAASPLQHDSKEHDDCEILVDPFPKPRPDAEITKDISLQYPEPMRRVEEYTMREDEPATFVQDVTENTNDSRTNESNEPRENDNADDSADPSAVEELAAAEILPKSQNETVANEANEGTPISADDTETNGSPRIKSIIGYRMINPHRLVLHGTENCLAEEFPMKSRGRQGTSLALAAIAYAKIKAPGTWRNIDVDQIVRVGDEAHTDIVNWIRRGSPAAAGSEEFEKDEEAADEDDEEARVDEDQDEDDEGAIDDDDQEQAGMTKSSKGFVKPTPSHIDVSMLPANVKFGDNRVTFLKKESVIDGVADPLANLGEALERYFDKYSELILENKRLAYGIWKQDDKYFLLNPYGGDEEGWRCRNYPACLVVTDSINELVDLSHGLLEFNDKMFSLHFVGVESIQPGEKYVAPFPLEIPTEDSFVEKYRTRFLPVTDQDLFKPELDSPALIDEEKKPDERKQQDEENEDEDEEEEDEEEEEEAEEGGDEKDGERDVKTRGINVAELEDRIFEDPLVEIEEQEFPDAPERLNLSLLTQGVKIQDDTIEVNALNESTRLYERLKYKHPPPYVLPPEKVLCVLLDAKKASGSMHSLVSRFSIDSRLAVKAAITDFPAEKAAVNAIVSVVASNDEGKASRMIKLPPSKYLFSRIPAIGAYTPLRAINEKFIQDETVDRAREQECRETRKNIGDNKTVLREMSEDATRPIPSIIPLGPTIKTPTPKRKSKGCGSGHSKTRTCRISEYPPELREDPMLQKILCKTDNVLFDMIFPKRRDDDGIIVEPDDLEAMEENEEAGVKYSSPEDNRESATKPGGSGVRINEIQEASSELRISEIHGFIETDDNVGIIVGNASLKNRNLVVSCHFRECLFAAILCIIGKIGTNVRVIRGTILDQFVLAAEKIGHRTGNLGFKPTRCFHNIVVLGAKCNVKMKQTNYADPENCETDQLSTMLEAYLKKNQTGILALENASYAFWTANGRYYVFDPYACDANGRANDNGAACLLEFCESRDMFQRIRDNNPATVDKPYRLYSLSIAHMESVGAASKSAGGKRWRRRRRRLCAKKIVSAETIVPEESLSLDEGIQRQVSLIELPEWVTNVGKNEGETRVATRGFEPMKNLDASTLVVPVVENDVTRPERAPLKKQKTPFASLDSASRKKPYDRKFTEHTCIGEPIDLCIIAWSCVRDPNLWGLRTIRGIYEAAKDLAYDSLLAAEDTNNAELTDGLLEEFIIGNYSFRAVFPPLHRGKLYAPEGWNLAMSLKTFLDVPIYSGIVLVCEKSHIGMMKKGETYYAWWTVTGTKNLRIVSCRDESEFLKLLVGTIGEIEMRDFVMRIVTISYARKLDPDCSDVYLREINSPPGASSIARRIRSTENYDLQAVFRSTTVSPESSGKPLVISGNAALDDRDVITEPRVKRCYYVAIVSIMIKRDIVQSPMPAMIDRVIHVADNLYREFNEAKFHTEHILRNVTLMNRTFDFRDCASALHLLRSTNGKTDFYQIVRKQLRRHFVRHTDGLAQFTNCCYGFWYSRASNAYYYVDPYRCDARGLRAKVHNTGGACLFVCSSICQMAKQWCVNRHRETTGFFIHRVHVESIDVVAPCEKFIEDPMWVYLDYHWSFRRWTSPDEAEREGGRDEERKGSNPSWNSYTIEVPNLIYSVWGTIGSHDARFGNRAGLNRDAICIVVSSMRCVCHPSRWSAAVLDSSVICGDSYYTESTKGSARRGARYPNPLNLQPCLKIHPHTWQVEYLPDTCGILYGGSGPDLATSLKMALDDIDDDATSVSLVVQCETVSLAVLSCDDGFYVIDPCWIGPPLFAKNHGAIYALRCRNLNALVYAITKILNTNRRVEFRVIPIALRFDRDICNEGRGARDKRTILTDAVANEPGIVADNFSVYRGTTQPDEDSYFVYRRNLRAGIRQRDNEESPATTAIPIDRETANNLSISANWHLNLGKDNPKKRSAPIYDSSVMDPCRCRGIVVDPMFAGSISIDDEIRLCDDYPRTIDLAADKVRTRSTKILTGRRDIAAELPETVPPDCTPPRQFLSEIGRREFRRSNREMADETRKTRKHGVSSELQEVATDGEDDPNVAAAPINENDRETILNDEATTPNDQEETIDDQDA